MVTLLTIVCWVAFTVLMATMLLVLGLFTCLAVHDVFWGCDADTSAERCG